MTESVQVAIGVIDGKVVAKWQEPCNEITFDPKNAYSVGMALAQAGMDAHNGSPVNGHAFLADELQKPKITDAQRDRLIAIVATQIKTLQEKGRSPGMIAIHAVDAVLQETAR
jgi:nitrous oxide reductase accessory protein NosL